MLGGLPTCLNPRLPSATTRLAPFDFPSLPTLYGPSGREWSRKPFEKLVVTLTGLCQPPQTIDQPKC